jgi:hypothetical protein
MARGWESKNVESQQEDASRSKAGKPVPTAAELARAADRRSLELTRKRVADDLRRASAPAHRKMLEEAMESLNKQLADLK